MKIYSARSVNGVLADETGNIELNTDAHENTVNKTNNYQSNIGSTVKFLNIEGTEAFWSYVKEREQTITGIWNFIEGIKVERVNGDYTYTSQLLHNVLSIQVNSIHGLVMTQYEMGLIKFISNGFYTVFQPSTPTQFNTITLPNKSGTVALTSDLPTRFSKNVRPSQGTNIFQKDNSSQGDIIPAFGSLGKIYPMGINSNTDMINGDIIESSFVIYRGTGPESSDYVFRLEFWRTNDSGVLEAVYGTYNYTWDTVAFPAISVKIILTKLSDLTAYGYLQSYIVLINGIYVYKIGNFYSWEKSDCRMFLINNNSGVNTITFPQAQAVNLFIPIASSLT